MSIRQKGVSSETTYLYELNEHNIQVGEGSTRLHIEAQLLLKVPPERDRAHKPADQVTDGLALIIQGHGATQV